MDLFSEQCAFNSVNSGNMKQRNSLTSNNKQTGRRPADMLDIYIEDITRGREDMNFIFEWQNNILRTSAASE